MGCVLTAAQFLGTKNTEWMLSRAHGWSQGPWVVPAAASNEPGLCKVMMWLPGEVVTARKEFWCLGGGYMAYPRCLRRTAAPGRRGEEAPGTGKSPAGLNAKGL